MGTHPDYDHEIDEHGPPNADDTEPMETPKAPPPDPMAPDLDRHFKPLSQRAERWLEDTPPPQTWLLAVGSDVVEHKDGTAEEGAGGVLPLGRVGMVTAEGGAGKTFAVSQLALAVATGTPWLGSFEVRSPGRVLLACGEEDEPEVWRRLKRAAYALKLSDDHKEQALSRIFVLPLAGCHVALNDSQGAPTPLFLELRERAEAVAADGEPWRLLVFDPLSRFGGPEVEKDNYSATKIVQTFEALTKLPGNPTVLFTHHTNKTSRDEKHGKATAARGSSALTDGVRWQAHLEPLRSRGDALFVSDLVCFSVTKTNVGTWPKDVWVQRDPDSGVLVAATKDDFEKLQTIAAANKIIATRLKVHRTKEATERAEAWLRKNKPEAVKDGTADVKGDWKEGF